MASKEINERVNPIVIRNEETGDVYTLEFDRDSVRFAESRGFDIEDVTKYPLTKVPELFWYAFRMHHKSVSKEKADRILFDDLGGLPDGAGERLINLYGATMNSLNNSENKPKNPKVTVEL